MNAEASDENFLTGATALARRFGEARRVVLGADLAAVFTGY